MPDLPPQPCLFSIDVEDWFHILDLPSTPPIQRWAELPTRVESNFGRLLDLLASHDVKATCFFLGWVAERFPNLVKRAVKEGHEIASHGYAHELAYVQGREKFLDDAFHSRELLEDISGQSVIGYRATGFSVNEATPWFFDALLEAGYQYDSSIFPMTRGHGGMTGGELGPHLVTRDAGELIEIPVSVSTLAGRRVCVFGGGYLRIAPEFLIDRMTQRVLAAGRPVTIYIHPREIDPDHPRLPMPPMRRFKSYVNLHSVEKKLRCLLSKYPFVRYDQYAKSLMAEGRPMK